MGSIAGRGGAAYTNLTGATTSNLRIGGHMTEQEFGTLVMYGLVTLGLAGVVIIWFNELFLYIDRKNGKDRHDD
jgi:hypothetical protein